MSTIFDYLDYVAYDSIYDRPFKELDILALTELTYLPFDRIVPQGDTTNIEVRLSDAAELVDRTTDFIVTDQHLQLVDVLATSKRFKNLKLLNYVDEYDPDVQKQFAAMTYRLTMDVYLVVFRGTDDTFDRLEGRLPHDLYGPCPISEACSQLPTTCHEGIS